MRNRYYVLAASILILDHLTKWLIRMRFSLHEGFEIIPGYLRLSYVRNTGVAFGYFSEYQAGWKPYALAGLAVIAVIAIVFYASRMPAERKLLQSALAVTMGGIVGNFLDRIARGYVVDFIEFHYLDKFYWPTFNVADTAISVGIGMLLLDTVINPEQEPVRQENENEHPPR